MTHTQATIELFIPGVPAPSGSKTGFPIKRKTEDQTQRFQFQIGTAF